MSVSRRVFVVTGSNKGIGFATVRALCRTAGSDAVVYLTSRSEERGNDAVQKLIKEGWNPRFHLLDVDDVLSIATFASFLKNEHGGLDVLVNNAAIAYQDDATEPFGEKAENTIRVNYFGLKSVSKALFPLLRPHARVVNLSSSQGHLTRVPGAELRARLASRQLTESELDQIMRDFVKAAATCSTESLGWPSNTSYAPSKVAVSALTRIQQRQFDADSREDLVVNHCHPGYTDTDMTLHKGPLTPDEAALCPTYLALLPPNIASPRGEYVWFNKSIIDWVNGPLPDKSSQYSCVLIG